VKLGAFRSLADVHGLLVYEDLVPAQLTRAAWQHGHDTGLLVRVHRGVSRPVDTVESVELLLAAAIAAAGRSSG
jgi:hypothetical protein